MPAEKPKITVKQVREKLEPRFERFFLKDVAVVMMQEARGEFPPETQALLDKVAAGNKLDLTERKKFNVARNDFWEKRFGGTFDEMSGAHPRITSPEVASAGSPTKINIESERKARKIESIEKQKVEKMQALHQVLRNLDAGEIVEEFRDETRRIIYFDEEHQKYYILENDKPRFLEVADVLSDYAWGIKYVPDGEMTEPAYRNLAKRILTNETRRDLEGLYNKELHIQDVRAGFVGKLGMVEKNWVEHKRQIGLGFLAEIMARELLTRIAITKKLNFVVERANAVEDGVYKYDFKVRSLVKLRGVGVGDEEEINSRIKKLGLQFTIRRQSGGGKLQDIKNVRQLMLETKLPVDDIVLCKVQAPAFGTAFDKWIAEGKPSGGPEQFLLAGIKDKLLEAVQDRLFEKSKGREIYIH